MLPRALNVGQRGSGPLGARKPWSSKACTNRAQRQQPQHAPPHRLLLKPQRASLLPPAVSAAAAGHPHHALLPVLHQHQT
jgi:hypothetical protein